MSFENAVQDSVYDCLRASAALAAVVGVRVYDSVPQNVTFPYVVIGEDIHTEWSAHYEVGSSASITVHTWSRHRGQKETKTIQGLIFAALDRITLTAAGYDIISCDSEGSQSFLDVDGLTRHGISTFKVLLEKI